MVAKTDSSQRVSKHELNLAGWFAIIVAVADIPVFAFTIYSGIAQNPSIDILRSGVNIIYFFVNAYILLLFKKVLNTHYSFHKIDRLIDIAICLFIVPVVTTLLLLISPAFEVLAAVIDIIILIVSSIVTLVIATKLLRLHNKLIRLVAYLTLASGICILTIIFFPFAVIIDVAVNIVLAIFFFHEEDE